MLQSCVKAIYILLAIAIEQIYMRVMSVIAFVHWSKKNFIKQIKSIVQALPCISLGQSRTKLYTLFRTDSHKMCTLFRTEESKTITCPERH